MQQIKIKYRFLFFLYAYLRQINLSLDRVRWVSWSELKKYYKSQITVLEVSDQLFKNSGLKPSVNPIVYFPKEPSIFKRVEESFLRLMKRHYLSTIEILYCHQLLQRFNLLLEQDFPDYPLEAEKLRQDIAMFYSFILGHKLSRKDWETAMKVEHFMQNENLAVIKIDLFATGAY